MATKFVAYIDEAGDEGFGKLGKAEGGQSDWLILGCALAEHDFDLALPFLRNEIMKRFPKKKTKTLHFRDLKHEQKIVACQEIGKFDVSACLTLSHKVTLPGTKWFNTFKQKGYLYNYLLRFLLERVTRHCYGFGGSSCELKLVFSRRSGTDYNSMKEYLILMRDGREVMQPVRQIYWDVLDVENIVVETHDRWAGLQIADCFCSAHFQAIEPNFYGNYEPAYADLLRSNLLVDPQGHVLNCGLTAVPSFAKTRRDERQEAYFDSYRKK